MKNIESRYREILRVDIKTKVVDMFANKVALITGASSGIGRATAIRFAKDGAHVVLSDILDSQGEELAKKLQEESKGSVTYKHCDMSNPSQIKELFDFIKDQFQGLDFAFNNAGIEGAPASIQDCTMENWTRTIDINLRGVWLCMKYEIELMLKKNSGSIVNCSSIAGLVGFANIPAYVASKHGVVGLTKAAALENAQNGVRINAVCPGVVETPMITRFTSGSDEALQQLVKNQPIGRMGRPEEIAGVVAWLCSDDSSFVTGQAIAADGGWVAQ